MAVQLNNLTIETAGTEEEAVESLGAALSMEMEVNGEGEVEGEEGVEGTQRSMGALESLIQEAEPSRTMLVDARNGFNKLRRLAMLWIVQHR